jgi:hypothetical protein
MNTPDQGGTMAETEIQASWPERDAYIVTGSGPLSDRSREILATPAEPEHDPACQHPDACYEHCPLCRDPESEPEVGG